MPLTYWFVGPDGDRRPVDPTRSDLDRLAEQADRSGGRLVVEGRVGSVASRAYEPPVSALGLLFRERFSKIHKCRVEYSLDINTRPTVRVLGGYYRTRRLVRIYTHDRQTGRRRLEELFDTFLHEMAHHLEYTEPATFNARRCQRVHGRMHSDLFWRILGLLKDRWAGLQWSEGALNRAERFED